MKSFVCVALAVLLLGCAQQPRTPPNINAPEAQAKPASPQERARIHTELAGAYYTHGNYAVALQETQTAIDADSNYGPAYYVRGLVHMALREDDAADQDFQRALRINPNDSEANNNYGWFLCNRGREKDSIAYFLTALKNPLYPTPELALTNAGVCSRKAGDDKAAEDYLVKALRLQPNQPLALQEYGDLLYRKGDYANAKLTITRFLQVAQPTPEMLWLAVLTERRLGDRSAEANYGLQLRRRFPDSKEAQLLKSGVTP